MLQLLRSVMGTLLLICHTVSALNAHAAADWHKLQRLQDKSAVDPETVAHAISVAGPLKVYNGEVFVSLYEGNIAHFYDLPLKDLSVLPMDQDNIFKHTNPADSVLLIAKPFESSNWHHSIFDAIIPAMRALEHMDMLDHHVNTSKVTLLFANPVDWDQSRTGRTLKELLHLHLPTAYLDLQTFWADHSAQEEMWTWDRVVLLGKDSQPDWEAAEVDPAFVETYLAFRQRTINKVEQQDMIDIHPLNQDGRGSEGSAEAGAGEGAEGDQTARQRVLLVHRPTGQKRSFDNGETVTQTVHEVTAGVANVASHGCGLWFFDQFNLFHSTDVVVGAHGACLSNMLWMRPGASVVEILPFGYSAPLYRQLAMMLSLRYFTVMSEATDSRHFTGRYTCQEDSTDAPSEEECRSKRKNTHPCCNEYLRDQKILVNPDVLKDVLQKALQKDYKPQCRAQVVEEGSVLLCT